MINAALTRSAAELGGHERAAAFVQPQAIVTLKVADDRDHVMWVEDSVGRVMALIADGRGTKTSRSVKPPMIRLRRVRGMKAEDFWTRYDNVANVEAYH